MKNLTVIFFCDVESYKVEALQSRVKRAHPMINPTFLVGDANCLVEKIKASIPIASKSFKVLTFCLFDPYKVDSLSFETIRQLSSLYIDFLILIPSYMDANRNRFNYIERPATEGRGGEKLYPSCCDPIIMIT